MRLETYVFQLSQEKKGFGGFCRESRRLILPFFGLLYRFGCPIGQLELRDNGVS